MKTVTFPDGESRPALGLGTWRMGESAGRRRDEVAAVRCAIEMGYRVIDTAEMYGEGEAESIVGEAVAAALRAGTVSREQLFIVSKVYPHNASREGAPAACERSRRRLGLDTIDLYLLHWRGPHALAETVAAFEALRSAGRIRHWGVSNLDRDDMDELSAVPDGARCAANQVYYSLGERGAGFDLLPWLQHRGVPLMAYCPIDQGRLGRDKQLAEIGARHGGASAAQVGLTWLLAQDGVMAIPKAVREAHLRENLAAADLQLTRDDLIAIDARFAPPRRRTPLAMS
jgi:diketogulonate reductase-like aldo/keto reductase